MIQSRATIMLSSSKSSNNNRKSSLLKRLSLRRPFKRAPPRVASPVSVLDDAAEFLLSPPSSKDKLDSVPTYSSMSVEEEEDKHQGLWSEQDVGWSAKEAIRRGVVSNDKSIEQVERVPVVQAEEIAPQTLTAYLLKSPTVGGRSLAKELEGEVPTWPAQAPISLSPPTREILVVTQKKKAADESLSKGAQAIDSSQGHVSESEFVETSPARKNETLPLISNGSSNHHELEVGRRVYIQGGSYKNDYGTIVKITSKRVRVNIDGKGSKQIDKKNVVVTHVATTTVVNSETPLVSTDSQASDEFNDNGSTTRTTTADNSQETVFKIGDVVVITKGNDKGKSGTIVEMTPKMVKIRVPGIAKLVSKRKTSIESLSTSENESTSEVSTVDVVEGLSPLLDSNAFREARSAAEPTIAANAAQDERDDSSETPLLTNITAQPSQEAALTIGQTVKVTKGNHTGESGTVVKITPRMVKIRIQGVAELVSKRKTSVVIAEDASNSTTLSDSQEDIATLSTDTSDDYAITGDEWRLPDSSGIGGLRFGNRIMIKIRTQRQEAKRKEQNFLTHLFQDRLLVMENAMNAEEMAEPFNVKFVGEGGFGYELVSSKIQNDGDAGGGSYCKPKCIHLVYAQVTGPRRESYSLKDELSRLGDFASLSTRKVVARLELLQSPAYQFTRSGKKEPGMFSLKRSDFVLHDIESNDGCGFISESLLLKLCSRGGATFASRTIALQVRIVIPKMGIFKGVLMRKRIPSSEPQIQLMPSMQKVKPSRHADLDERAFLWITQQGMHPSKNNLMIGRLVDPDAKPPPKSFKPKKISDEIVRLWRTLGVSNVICDSYVKASMKARGLEHASVVGATDPTNCLPPGTVFVTGMKHLAREMLFVTRFPCNLPVDGRLLPNVTRKPEKMSEDDWNWLNDLPFGAIIFSDTEESMKPTPELVADGDLDGDLYFVCWNEAIIANVEPVELTNIAVDSAIDSTEEPQSDEKWLEKAQQQMIDARKVYEMNELVGKLYNLSKAAATANDDLITADPEAMAFAAAYKHALQHGKHGGMIPLDPNLHERLSSRCHGYLTSP